MEHGLGESGPITFDNAGDLVVAAYDRQKGPYVRVITPTGQSEFQTRFKASRMTFDRADNLLYIGKGAEIEIIDFATKNVVGAINGVTDMRGMAIGPNPY